jgi:hypothetical protein
MPSSIAHVDAPDVPDTDRLPHDPMAALDKLTQLNGDEASAGANACGAVTLVAATVISSGWAGLPRLAERLRGELADDTHAELQQLGAAIAAGGPGATYGALAAYALALHHRYRGMDGGMPWDKLLHLMQVAGFSPPARATDGDVPRTLARVGQCWPAKIALDGGDEGDHWILAGHDARGYFVFDPYPREDGSQVVRQNEPDWKKYLAAIAQHEDGRNTIGFLPSAVTSFG